MRFTYSFSTRSSKSSTLRNLLIRIRYTLIHRTSSVGEFINQQIHRRNVARVFFLLLLSLGRFLSIANNTKYCEWTGSFNCVQWEKGKSNIGSNREESGERKKNVAQFDLTVISLFLFLFLSQLRAMVPFSNFYNTKAFA